MKFQSIKTDQLTPSPTNPRKDFDENCILDMAESLRSVGMLEPILCVERRDKFEIVAGETRWRAALRVPMAEVPCVVREMSQKEIVHAQMAENISRASLNPMEEAEGLKQIIDLGEADEESISKALGTSRKWVQSRLALNNLPETARDAVRVRAMSVTIAHEILSLEDQERDEATEMLLDFGEEITAAQARQTLSEKYRLPRERRRQWLQKWEESLKEIYGEFADPLEDCEEWAKYLRPYGEPYGHWVLGIDPIGAAAAKISDSALAWQDLAKALGVRGLVVPLHGDLYTIFDRSKIEALEKSSRESGGPHTLGPRKREEESSVDESVDDDEEQSPETEDPQDDESMEDYYITRILKSIEDQLREDPSPLHYILNDFSVELGSQISALVALRKEAE